MASKSARRGTANPDRGRCGGKSLTSQGRHQSWNLHQRFVLDPESGDPLLVNHWKDLAKIQESFKQRGLKFEGQVMLVSRANFEKLKLENFNASNLQSARAEGLVFEEYMDTSTMRGGYPQDCPQGLRDQIGALTNDVQEYFMFKTSTEGIRDFRASLAYAARQAAYPRMTNRELFEVAQGIFPGLGTASYGKYGVELHNRFHLYEGLLNTRVAQPSDMEAALGKLISEKSLIVGPWHYSEENVRTASDDFKEEFNHFPSIISWDKKGEIESFSLFKPDAFKGYLPIYEVHTGWYYSTGFSSTCTNVAENWAEKRSREGDFCFSCNFSPCKCFNSAREFADSLLQATHKTQGRLPTSEHRWGDSAAVKPSFALHAKAVSKVEEVKKALDDFFPNGHQAAIKKFGPTLPYNLALFLAQANQDVSVLKLGRESIFNELSDAVRRAHLSHDYYAKALYQEFEDPRTLTVKEKASEVYLGRDGIYAYSARQAQMRVIRGSMGAQARRERRLEENQLRYITVSREAQWVPSRHDSLLGEAPPVFVDTGFSGTIPEHIHRERSRENETKVPLEVRLFSTQISEYGFYENNLITRAHAVVVEHDAKPTKSTKKVNGAPPASAFEQLIFRQIRQEIMKKSEAQTRTLIKGKEIEDLSRDEIIAGAPVFPKALSVGHAQLLDIPKEPKPSKLKEALNKFFGKKLAEVA